jgi:hypothetical protein
MTPLAKRALVLPGFGALALVVLLAHGATAQSATGTVTGRVVWGPCIRGIPLPLSPDAQTQPGAPAGGITDQPVPGRPIPAPVNGLPAGAVLVAVQNTPINARTDEAGHFSLTSVPAGMYLTIAAGPVASASAAVAERPNVFVSGGQSVDLGTLSLGGSTSIGIACRLVPGVGVVPDMDTAPGTDTAPAPDVPPGSR